MSTSVPVPAGKHPLKIEVRIESSMNERVTITSASGSFNKVFTGTGHKSFEPLELPRQKEEVYEVLVEHATESDWQQSKTELHPPRFSAPRMGTLSVTGFDATPGTGKPNAIVEFHWSNVEL